MLIAADWAGFRHEPLGGNRRMWILARATALLLCTTLVFSAGAAAETLADYSCHSELGVYTSRVTGGALPGALITKELRRVSKIRNGLVRGRFILALRSVLNDIENCRNRSVQSGTNHRSGTGAIANYSMNEISGNLLLDSVASPTSLPLQFDPAKVGRLNASPGISITAVDGAARSVTAATKVVQAIKDSRRFSFEFWTTPQTITTNLTEVLLSIAGGTSTSQTNLLLTKQRSKLTLTLRYHAAGRNRTVTTSFANAILEPNAAHHVVLSYDGIGLRLFVDGALRGESLLNDVSFSSWSPRAYLSVGNGVALRNRMLGKLHLLAIFPRALSTEEVSANFVAGYIAPTSSSSPPLSSSSSTSLVSISSNSSASSQGTTSSSLATSSDLSSSSPPGSSFSSVATSGASSSVSSQPSQSSSSSSDQSIIMTPGSNVGVAISQPPAVGNPTARGYDARAIARFDVVPYQTVTARLNVGVVAFHIAGIDYVAFSLNGGPFVRISQMLLNPHTGVVEYFATFDPALLSADGVAEVRAIAYPKVGIPRVLEAIKLYGNARGSLPGLVRYVSNAGSDTSNDGTIGRPFLTIAHAIIHLQSAQGNADGGTIYLAEGHYSAQIGTPLISNTNRWVTIAGAPGSDRLRVLLDSPGQSGPVRFLHLKNLTIQTLDRGTPTAPEPPPILFGNEAGQLLTSWLDGLYVRGTSRYLSGAAIGGYQAGYITDTTFKIASRGIGGNLIRNTLLDESTGVALWNAPFVINTTVNDLTITDQPAGWDIHPDIYMTYTTEPIENWIVYGLKATNFTARGMALYSYNSGFTNCAFVNVLLDTARSTGWAYSAMTLRADHVLFWNMNHLGLGFYWWRNSAEGIALRNVDFKGNVVDALGYLTDGNPDSSIVPSVNAGISMDNNHFTNNIPSGTRYTTGDPMFTDQAGGDYSPQPGSPLRNRIVAPLPVGVDLFSSTRPIPATLGAVE